MVYRPKVKCKTITVLGNNIGVNLDDLGYGDDFPDLAKAGSMTELRS